MNFTYTNFAALDAGAVLGLIDNGEWDRALTRAQVLIDSIKMAMSELGIEPTSTHIHDTTPDQSRWGLQPMPPNWSKE